MTHCGSEAGSFAQCEHRRLCLQVGAFGSADPAAGQPAPGHSSAKRKREDGEHRGRVKWLRASEAHGSPARRSRAALLHLMRCNPRLGHHLVRPHDPLALAKGQPVAGQDFHAHHASCCCHSGSMLIDSERSPRCIVEGLIIFACTGQAVQAPGTLAKGQAQPVKQWSSPGSRPAVSAGSSGHSHV